MKAFAQLYAELDQTTSINEKVAALVRYFRSVSADDASWAIYFLSGRKVKRAVTSTRLKEWSLEVANIPDWLFDECYEAVGDLAETIALMLPDGADPAWQTVQSKPAIDDDQPVDLFSGLDDEPVSSAFEVPVQMRGTTAMATSSRLSLTTWVTNELLLMPNWSDSARRRAILAAWQASDAGTRLVLNKLLTGSFRVGVSQLLIVRALAQISQIDKAVISHRLMGEWIPSRRFYEQLVNQETQETHASQPYPFYLAHPLEHAPEQLGSIEDWQAEWKWDGIRAQLICRSGEIYLWSRGEELVTDRYPEIIESARRLPKGVVLDGELLPWKHGRAESFALLQKRIGRKQVSKRLLEEVPVVFMAYDLLEDGGIDQRQRPLHERRFALERLAHEQQSANPATRIMLSPTVSATSWLDLAMARTQSRDQQVEGIMLKRRDSIYQSGRVRGDWWKWKIEPMSIDAVLTAAQRGHGKRASLYTDYTFSVWHHDQLVTIAKAYSGLTDEEIRDVDAFVRANTLERFGPVRSVKPELVFELGFEGIQRSTRHKCGYAFRFPRILRARPDKAIGDANSLVDVEDLLRGIESS